MNEFSIFLLLQIKLLRESYIFACINDAGAPFTYNLADT